MDSARISLLQLIVAAGIIAAIESGIVIIVASNWFVGMKGISGLTLTGAARLAAASLLLFLFYRSPGGLSVIGLAPGRLTSGIRAGLVWSLSFGIVAGMLALGLVFAGLDPLELTRVNLPDDARRAALFFLVGGLAAPVAEELFFRGVIYGFLRQRLQPTLGKAGIAWAIVLSTLLFVGAHGVGGGLPLTQLIGGLVFCLAYEQSGSLATPIIIHCTGNTALFFLSFLAA